MYIFLRKLIFASIHNIIFITLLYYTPYIKEIYNYNICVQVFNIYLSPSSIPVSHFEISKMH